MREDMKAVIADTFSQMLDKEDIDKITVTKLIAECQSQGRHFIITLKILWMCWSGRSGVPRRSWCRRA